MVYGTAIDTEQAKQQLRRFILEFEHSCQRDGEMVVEKVYRNRLSEMESEESHVFEVDGRHLR